MSSLLAGQGVVYLSAGLLFRVGVGINLSTSSRFLEPASTLDFVSIPTSAARCGSISREGLCYGLLFLQRLVPLNRALLEEVLTFKPSKAFGIAFLKLS